MRNRNVRLRLSRFLKAVPPICALTVTMANAGSMFGQEAPAAVSKTAVAGTSDWDQWKNN